MPRPVSNRWKSIRWCDGSGRPWRGSSAKPNGCWVQKSNLAVNGYGMFAQPGCEQSALLDDRGERLATLPVLVLNVHSRCNCRCVMCDIWKTTESLQLRPTDLERQLDSIRSLGVRWVVLTGGEPLLHSHLDRLVAILRKENIRITLLTTGLLLKRHASMVASNFSDVIISLDGPPEIHDRIRRVTNAFASLQEGIASLRAHNPLIEIGLRMTVQRANHAQLRAAVEVAKDLSVNWISFLAADLTSTAFN